jgi:2,3-bisphosphoglycerate-independent phosphoglycerate mutase
LKIHKEKLIVVKPVMLMILDGWGIREMETGNAVLLADTPNYDRWLHTLERSILDASGEAVGLVPEQMGNSEVGHLNLGAGRIVYQDISRINNAIRGATLATNPALVNAITNVQNNYSHLHLIGLLGPGGVHAHETHLFALLDIAAAHGIVPIIHVITDGRDTPPNSAIDFLAKLDNYLARTGNGVIATVSGRYYAMDRDKRWERTKRAYDAIVFRQSENHALTAHQAIQQSYDASVTDEFILPTVIGVGDAMRVQPGDSVVFYNFRADRMRQIVKAFAFENQDGFDPSHYIPNLTLASMTQYEDDLPVDVLFGMDIQHNVLAEVISNAGLKQYHTAETEKYPHVTYFFNGRREDLFPGEERTVIPSPKVATYDLKPEMSAQELTDATLQRLRTHDDDFILINYANPDMVGHTGSLEAAIKAVSFVDRCAGVLVDAVNQKGGVALVTADHGNAERMIELTTGQPHTYHTTNPVSLFVINGGRSYVKLRPRGILADVAPTILDLLGVQQPHEMTGRTLIDLGADKE